MFISLCIPARCHNPLLFVRALIYLYRYCLRNKVVNYHHLVIDLAKISDAERLGRFDKIPTSLSHTALDNMDTYHILVTVSFHIHESFVLNDWLVFTTWKEICTYLMYYVSCNAVVHPWNTQFSFLAILCFFGSQGVQNNRKIVVPIFMHFNTFGQCLMLKYFCRY